MCEIIQADSSRGPLSLEARLQFEQQISHYTENLYCIQLATGPTPPIMCYRILVIIELSTFQNAQQKVYESFAGSLYNSSCYAEGSHTEYIGKVCVKELQKHCG